MSVCQLCLLRCVMFSATVLIGMVTILLTSDMTVVGMRVHRELAQKCRFSMCGTPIRTTWLHVLEIQDINNASQHVSQYVSDFEPSQGAIGGIITSMALLTLSGYISDIVDWKRFACVREVYLVVFAALGLAVLLLCTSFFPLAPIFVGVGTNMVVWQLLMLCFRWHDKQRKTLYNCFQARIIACHFMVAISVTIFLAWLVPGFSDHIPFLLSPWSPEVRNDFANPEDQHVATVRFMAPVILAYLYFLVLACTGMRLSLEFEKESSLNNHMRFSRSMKVVLGLLFASIAGLVTSSEFLSVSEQATNMVRTAGVATATCIVLYMGWVMRKEIMQDTTITWLLDLLQSSTAKGAAVLLLLPLSPLLLPLLYITDVAHQGVRKQLRRCQVLEADPDDPSFYEEGTTKQWRYLRSSEPAALMRTSMYLSLAIVVFRAVAAFVPPLMAWLGATLTLKPWPVVFSINFAVAMALFLLPPVSGQMIYLPISLMIIEKYGYSDTTSLCVAVLIATFFCLAMKLVASALQQKAVGAPFSTNIVIKKTFGLHSSFFRVARSILSERGVTWRKVIVLVGMPDWPVSVLCGVLDLPLIPVMISTLPEFFKILPNCIAVAMLLKSRDESDMKETFNVLFLVFLGLGLLVSGLTNILVTMLVKKEMDAHKEEFENPGSTFFRDPQEAEILAALESDEQQASILQQRLSWNMQPCLIRVFLVVGSVAASIAVYSLAMKPFHSFDFRDPNSLARIPGGSIFGLITASGHAMLGSAAIVCLCLVLFKLWSLLAEPLPREDQHISSNKRGKSSTALSRV